MTDQSDIKAAYVDLLKQARGVLSKRESRLAACYAREAGVQTGRIAQALEVPKTKVNYWWWRWRKTTQRLDTKDKNR